MRVSDNQFSSMMTQAMMNSSIQINKVAEQIATGEKINHLSDNPAASVKLEGLQKTISSSQQYQSNIKNVQSSYEQYETYMMSINDITKDVHDLLLQAKNSTLDADSMTGIVTEIETLKKQALKTLNKQVDGVYLFSGTDVYSPAIEETPPYAFLGNNDHRETKVGEGETIVNNFTAQDILAGSSEFFTALDAAIAEMKSPTDDFQDTLAAALDVTSAAQQNILNSVSVLGANYNSLERMMDNNIDTELFAKTIQSDINELDYAEASVRLAQNMTTLEAAQKTFTKVMNSTSLFDLI